MVASASAIPEPAELQNGDRMTQEEFHRVYKRMPPHVKAELIGGIVYVASPLGRNHGARHMPLSAVLFAYEGHTPGVESGDNATILLGDQGEPQPDLFLRILPEFGGQSHTVDDNIVGAPELIIEIASSSRAIDLHLKRHDYARYGVREYLVATLHEQELCWFDLRSGRQLQPDADGVIRVHTFPGLWINQAAVFSRNYQMLMQTLQQGLATAEHADFLQRLARAQTRDGGPH